MKPAVTRISLAAGCCLATAAVPAVAGAATAATATATAAPATARVPASDIITVRPGRTAQVINGFGFAEAFREPVITALPTAERQHVEAALFDRSTGAGFSIVRFGLGGATDPGDPISGPGDVADQVWLGRAAERYGVHQFYADAWSAPAAMKTNGSLDNGGYLCGAPGETCAAGDKRQAYAALLAAQAKGFAREGMPLAGIDFVNEPEIGPAYASMLMTPAQAADFVPYLGRALRRDHLATKVACCDAEGWTDGAAYTRAVLGSPSAARYVGLITSHGYTAPPTVPLTSARPVWESEWADFSAWDPAWDDGTAGSGLTWAEHIQTALTRAHVNAFFYWWGASASTANSGLIQVAGANVNLSKRYWAFAAFSRFIRPGAVRVGASTAGAALEVSAFRNRDGSMVVEAINSGTTAQPVRLRLAGVPGQPGLSSATAYLTDATHSLAPESVTAGATAPPRSLTTWVIPRR